jgi:hypothetical protein
VEGGQKMGYRLEKAFARLLDSKPDENAYMPLLIVTLLRCGGGLVRTLPYRLANEREHIALTSSGTSAFEYVVACTVYWVYN